MQPNNWEETHRALRDIKHYIDKWDLKKPTVTEVVNEFMSLLTEEEKMFLDACSTTLSFRDEMIKRYSKHTPAYTLKTCSMFCRDVLEEIRKRYFFSFGTLAVLTYFFEKRLFIKHKDEVKSQEWPLLSSLN